MQKEAGLLSVCVLVFSLKLFLTNMTLAFAHFSKKKKKTKKKKKKKKKKRNNVSKEACGGKPSVRAVVRAVYLHRLFSSALDSSGPDMSSSSCLPPAFSHGSPPQ